MFRFFRKLRLKALNKKNAPAIGNVEKYLRERFAGRISEETLSELAEVIAQEYVRKIKINVLEESEMIVKFSCNLAPDEVRARHEEVREFLPRTAAGDDWMFSVLLKEGGAWYKEKYMPKQSKNGEWVYFAFP